MCISCLHFLPKKNSQKIWYGCRIFNGFPTGKTNPKCLTLFRFGAHRMVFGCGAGSVKVPAGKGSSPAAACKLDDETEFHRRVETVPNKTASEKEKIIKDSTPQCRRGGKKVAVSVIVFGFLLSKWHIFPARLKKDGEICDETNTSFFQFVWTLPAVLVPGAMLAKVRKSHTKYCLGGGQNTPSFSCSHFSCLLGRAQL